MSALGDYLALAARTPWNHGDQPGPKHDCCTFVAGWCVAAGYPDPMAFIRDRYGSEAEALELMQQKGLPWLVEKGCDSIGLKRTKAPVTGDIAVLRRATVDGQDVTCAIRSNERWVTLLERGLVVDASGDVLRAWRVEWVKR